MFVKIDAVVDRQLVWIIREGTVSCNVNRFNLVVPHCSNISTDKVCNAVVFESYREVHSSERAGRKCCCWSKATDTEPTLDG